MMLAVSSREFNLYCMYIHKYISTHSYEVSLGAKTFSAFTHKLRFAELHFCWECLQFDNVLTAQTSLQFA